MKLCILRTAIHPSSTKAFRQSIPLWWLLLFGLRMNTSTNLIPWLPRIKLISSVCTSFFHVLSLFLFYYCNNVTYHVVFEFLSTFFYFISTKYLHWTCVKFVDEELFGNSILQSGVFHDLSANTSPIKSITFSPSQVHISSN